MAFAKGSYCNKGLAFQSSEVQKPLVLGLLPPYKLPGFSRRIGAPGPA